MKIKDWEKFNESVEGEQLELDFGEEYRSINTDLADEIINGEDQNALLKNKDKILNDNKFLRYLMDNGLITSSKWRLGILYRLIAKENKIESLKVLVNEYGDTVRSRTTGRDNILKYAAEYGNFEMVEFLLNSRKFGDEDIVTALNWLNFSKKIDKKADSDMKNLLKSKSHADIKEYRRSDGMISYKI